MGGGTGIGIAVVVGGGGGIIVGWIRRFIRDKNK